MSLRTFVVLSLLSAVCVAAEAPLPCPGLDLGALPRTNLMLYRTGSGAVQPVETIRQWAKRRSEIVHNMQLLMGPLPSKVKRCPLEPWIEEEIDKGTYVQRLMTYVSEPGSRVPAYLLIPKPVLRGRRKTPAILALHSTDAKYGHRVLVENVSKSYRAFGRDLAERGFVVLAPAYPHLANYTPDLETLGYRSGTMKAIWDNIRGLDLLETLPGVDRRGFGALGHSLGGHNAIYTAVFDQRIKAVVSSCGFDSYVDYMSGNISGWTSVRYMPGLAAYKDRLHEIPFDFYEMIGALAPRAIFVNAPLRDSNFKAESVDRILRAARPVYELHRAEAALVVEHPDAVHDFPDTTREHAYEFLDQHLNRRLHNRK